MGSGEWKGVMGKRGRGERESRVRERERETGKGGGKGRGGGLRRLIVGRGQGKG